MVKPTVTLDSIQSAARLLHPFIRHTPMLEACTTRLPMPHPCHLHFKLEQLQLTGSFKIRGATHKLLKFTDQQKRNGLVAASGGNHGRAVAYLGWKRSLPTTIFLPENTPEDKVAAIKRWKVAVRMAGQTLDEATQIAQFEAEQQGQGFIHPFADPDVISAQGTIALEILKDCPEIETILVPIGGGGLISGVAVATKALKPNIKIIGVEPEGCPTLYESLQAGRIIKVDDITTQVGTLAIAQTSELNFELIQQCVDDVVLVSDADMLNASRWLWREFGIAAELSGAASVAALREQKVSARENDRICAMISGMGSDGV